MFDAKTYHKNYYLKHRAQIIERAKLFYEKNKTKCLEQISDWAQKNPEKTREYARKWRENNRELANLRVAKWAASPKGKECRKISRKKRIDKLKLAMPSWADEKRIRDFYKNKPVGKTVDHIIPLSGVNVSGLHVLENLQYLNPKENSRKGIFYE